MCQKFTQPNLGSCWKYISLLTLLVRTPSTTKLLGLTIVSPCVMITGCFKRGLLNSGSTSEMPLRPLHQIYLAPCSDKKVILFWYREFSRRSVLRRVVASSIALLCGYLMTSYFAWSFPPLYCRPIHQLLLLILANQLQTVKSSETYLEYWCMMI